MARLILQRLLQSIPVLLAIAALTFVMVRAAPGGPFSQERRLPPAVEARLVEYYGLADPLPVQFGRYLLNLARGDLGPSLRYEGRRVGELIGESFPVSMELGFWGLAVALLIGVPIGVCAAARAGSWIDRLAMAGAIAGLCLPAFVMGPLLALVFGLWLGWCNVSGWSGWSDRLLPSLTLGLYYSAYVARLTRGGLLEVLPLDFVRTARAKGLPEWLILSRHCLRGGLLPLVAWLGPAAAGLISGSFVVETIFLVPGLGRHFVNAAFNRDYTMIMGTVLFFAALLILFNLAVDLLQAWLNPRLRHD